MSAMFWSLFFASVLLYPGYAQAVARRASSRIAVTDHVLPLVAAPHPHLITPSSKHLRKRRFSSTADPIVIANASLQDDGDSSTNVDTDQNISVADIDSNVLTLGGRVYMTNVSIAGHEYTLVIDTGSADTWIASSSFQCVSRISATVISQRACGFGVLYDRDDSNTFDKIQTHDFDVKYTDGEFLSGEMGTEELGIGGQNADELFVRQTIGVVDRGWWMGDGISSGLMGLAYPTLASNSDDLNYTTVVFSLFEDGRVPPIFSLALRRPTQRDPVAGGLLAIGGIPDVAHDGDFVSVPIHPIVSNTYAYYSVRVDGFDITPPTTHSSIRNHREHQRDRPPKSNTTPVNMIVDSGTTLLYLPDDTSDHIASLFDPPAVYNSVANTYRTPCDAKSPRVGVIIGGKSFYIHPDDLMNKSPGAVGGGGSLAGGDNSICTIAVQKSKGGSAILGDSWMKGVLAVFDVGNNEMKFAAREHY